MSQEPVTAKGSDVSFRTWYMDAISRELARSRRHERELTVLYIDLDNLGDINNSLGMAVGDRVIRTVASTLSRICRAEDYIWHHGEDEFIVALTETGSGTAEAVAERINEKVKAATGQIDKASEVSVSIGFSTFPVHAESLSELMQSSRSALYLAKSQGKGKAQAARQEDEQEEGAQTGAIEQKAADTDVWPSYHPARRNGDKVHDFLKREDETEEGGFQTFEPGGFLNDIETPIEDADEIAEPEDQSAKNGQISVLIAASGPLLLAGMREVLASDEKMYVIGEVKSHERLPDVIADLEPDIVFTDLQTAAANKFNALKRIKEEEFTCRIAIFTQEIDQDAITAAAEYNAEGVIKQDSSPHEVLSSLRSLDMGRTILPDEVQSAVDELESNRRLLNQLSERELEVLRLATEGKSNSQISEELFITVNTVRFHLANIYQKLNVSNRTEAANYYMSQGDDRENQQPAD